MKIGESPSEGGFPEDSYALTSGALGADHGRTALSGRCGIATPVEGEEPGLVILGEAVPHKGTSGQRILPEDIVSEIGGSILISNH